ncbi:hypothetical protein TNIN_468801 [Trichonephila inaurata madagascariensis]|uniref:Uncharacterized protein n=1 Tax=Trichonephila inaurata madagascariensis TaxID=2747483 RepID=A0A8X6MH61_9ARAC|nr:hypothetical protein TNIN_468801 [Trichonephila inaurata madagascariensis]
MCEEFSLGVAHPRPKGVFRFHGALVQTTTQEFVPDERKKSAISVDRLNPAFMEIDDPVPTQVKPVQLHPGLVQCRPRLRPGISDV